MDRVTKNQSARKVVKLGKSAMEKEQSTTPEIIFTSVPGKNCDSVDYVFDRITIMARRGRGLEESLYSQFFSKLTPREHFRKKIELDVLDFLLLTEVIQKQLKLRKKSKPFPEMDAESIPVKDILEKDFLNGEDGTYFILTYLEREFLYYLNKMIDGIPTQDIKVYSNVSILGTHK